jgi:hypothetical protein
MYIRTNEIYKIKRIISFFFFFSFSRKKGVDMRGGGNFAASTKNAYKNTHSL